MVHTGALPGTPRHSAPIEKIIDQAINEALILEQEGADAILIENMHDVPYLKGFAGPEIIACMTAVSTEIRKSVRIPVGIQILASANREALAVALASSLDFIRVEGFVFAHMADEGYTESCAAELLRYRKMIGAEHIRIFTDVRKKHASHALTADLNITDHIDAAGFFLSDGIIITGSSTGKEPILEDVVSAWNHTDLPVLTGSGITPENIGKYWNYADGFIVGSWIKTNGWWENPVSQERLRLLMEKVNELRKG